MPNPAVTLKIKRFRQRVRHHFRIKTPRVCVRRHYSWHWYITGLLALVVMLVAGTWWLTQRDESTQTRNELEHLRESMIKAQAELVVLRSQAGTEQSAVRMEQSSQKQLTVRLKALEQENATLKSDLALFEKLVPSTGIDSMLRIERFSVVSGTEPGKFRFRLLLAFQPSKAEREFHGRLQLTVTAVQAGKEIMLNLPSGKDVSAEYQLELRHFLRKEGNINLPAGCKIKNVEARILQGSAVKAKQLINY